MNVTKIDRMHYTDYAQEQEMEIEALEAILMDEFKGIQFSFIKRIFFQKNSLLRFLTITISSWEKA